MNSSIGRVEWPIVKTVTRSVSDVRHLSPTSTRRRMRFFSGIIHAYANDLLAPFEAGLRSGDVPARHGWFGGMGSDDGCAEGCGIEHHAARRLLDRAADTRVARLRVAYHWRRQRERERRGVVPEAGREDLACGT